MKNQNKNLTPISSPSHKNTRQQKIGHYSSDLSFKNKTISQQEKKILINNDYYYNK